MGKSVYALPPSETSDGGSGTMKNGGEQGTSEGSSLLVRDGTPMGEEANFLAASEELRFEAKLERLDAHTHDMWGREQAGLLGPQIVQSAALA